MMLASAPPATAAVALVFFLFFFNDTATTEIYTLSLHDALPIWFSPPLWTSTRQVVQDALPPQSCGSGKPSASAACRIEVFGATSPLKPWGWMNVIRGTTQPLPPPLLAGTGIASARCAPRTHD